MALCPLASVKRWSVHPGADQVMPFQPSPQKSHILRVQLPGETACVAK